MDQFTPCKKQQIHPAPEAESEQEPELTAKLEIKAKTEPKIEPPPQADPEPKVKSESIDPNEIPFLCPIKEHQDYYRPLLSSSEIIQTQSDFDFIVPLLLEFVCGEWDHSMTFFQSSIWKKIKSVLNTNRFLQNATICIENDDEDDPQSSKEKNMMMMEEAQSVMQTFSPPISEEEDINSSDFWNHFEKEHFESIWYYLKDYSHNHDYSEEEEEWWFVGVLNPKKITAESGKKIYCRVHFKHHYGYRTDTDEKLTFEFSDFNETFCKNVMKREHGREYLMRRHGQAMRKFSAGIEL